MKVFYIVNIILHLPASSFETCQQLKFPQNGLRAQSRVFPVLGLLPLASGKACFGMAFPPSPDETVNTAVTRSSLPHLWEQGIGREGKDDCWVGGCSISVPYTHNM
jgi:hypothetical protein